MLTYATVEDLKEFAAGRVLPADPLLEARLADAENDIDSMFASWPAGVNGRRIQIADLTGPQEDQLTRATCQQAIWRLTKGAAYFDGGAGGTVQGPDYTIEAGGFQLLSSEVRRTLGGMGILRTQARGRS